MFSTSDDATNLRPAVAGRTAEATGSSRRHSSDDDEYHSEDLDEVAEDEGHDDDDDDEEEEELDEYEEEPGVDGANSTSQEYYYEPAASNASTADYEFYDGPNEEISQINDTHGGRRRRSVDRTTSSRVNVDDARSRSSSSETSSSDAASTAVVHNTSTGSSTRSATAAASVRTWRRRGGGAGAVGRTVASATTPTTGAVDGRGTTISGRPETIPGSAGAAAITTPTADAAAALSTSSAAPPATTKMINAVESLDALYRCSRLREVAGSTSSEALSWQLSSAKPGNGVEQIRDNSIETYWQSDGVSQPHWIQIHFQRRIAISHVCLYLDYHLDESYTPKTIAIEAGMTAQDLVSATSPIPKIEFHEPSGWCIIPLCSPPDPLDGGDLYDDDNADGNNDDGDDNDDDNYDNEGGDGNNSDVGRDGDDKMLNLDKHFQKPLLKAHLIRISILSMHQNGRDTHIRRIALFARHHQQRQQLIQPFRSLSNSTSLSAVRLGRNGSEGSVQSENDNDGGTVERSENNPYSETDNSWYAEVWNHRRNSASPDFTALGRNSYSTIR